MTLPTYELTVLGANDLSLMRELNALFGRAFDEVGAYSGEPPDDGYLTKFLGRPHVVVIVAIEAGVVLGGLVAYQLEKFERRRSEFYIYDLAVEAAHRRRGVASACIERLRTIARERDGSVIFVQADPPDAPAIALYQKFGVAEQVLHFDLPL
jgi:aminoglycoside 3-N-acetyltransferase I